MKEFHVGQHVRMDSPAAGHERLRGDTGVVREVTCTMEAWVEVGELPPSLVDRWMNGTGRRHWVLLSPKECSPLPTITRDDWSAEHCTCMACGHVSPNGYGLETHEIASGPARAKALEEPATWLRLCGWLLPNNCHQGPDGFHNYNVWPIVRQLALKKIKDPEHYDRAVVNRLRSRAPEAITEAEVDAAVKRRLAVDAEVEKLLQRGE